MVDIDLLVINQYVMCNTSLWWVTQIYGNTYGLKSIKQTPN